MDERIELIGVLFRLGGRAEYDMTRVPGWAEAVDTHFAAHIDHPAVVWAKRLAGPYDVGFFVPMNLAVHVTSPPALEERVSLESSASLHRTWATYPDTARAFLEAARRFAVDAEFDRFLADHRAIVDSTETRLRRLVDEQVELDWFSPFWGVPPAVDFILVPGLLNGRASYGVDFTGSEGERELYAIAGVSDVDGAGVPSFDADFATVIVHEFNHSYVDPLVERHRQELGTVGEPLYASVADVMRARAYGSWESMMHESLVRAAVIRYLDHARGHEAAVEEGRAQAEAGFTWVPGLADLLAEYEADRARYPTMGSFMPRIVSFFAGLVEEG